MKKLGDNKVLLFEDKTKSERVHTVSVHHRLKLKVVCKLFTTDNILIIIIMYNIILMIVPLTFVCNLPD